MKFNLLKFREKYNSIIFWMLATGLIILFIFLYIAVPKDQYFDFYIYGLSVMNGFLFICIENRKSIINDSIENKFHELVGSYQRSHFLYAHHSVFVYNKIKDLNNIKDISRLHKEKHIKLIASNNVRFNHSKDMHRNKYYGKEMIKYSNIYVKLEDKIVNDNLLQEKPFRKIYQWIYCVWQLIINRSFQKDLKHLENFFGMRLDRELKRDDEEYRFQEEIFTEFDSLHEVIENLTDSVESSSTKNQELIEQLSLQIELIESNLNVSLNEAYTDK